MNRSWRNTSNNSSTGFVYFNTSNSFQSQSSQSRDTPEFLSFGSDTSPEGSPHGNHFSPSNYSSPRNRFNGKSPRQRGGRNQYYSPIKPTGGWRKNIGLSGTPEKNFNNTNNYHNYHENQHNQSRYNQTNGQKKKFHQNAPNQGFNSSAFYDPNCLKDPWAELEQKLSEERKTENKSLEELKSCQSVEQPPDMEVEEASSDESGSDDESEGMDSLS